MLQPRWLFSFEFGLDLCARTFDKAVVYNEPIIVSIGPVHQRVKVDQNLIIEGLSGAATKQPSSQPKKASSEVKTRSEKQQTSSIKHDLCCVKRVFDPNRERYMNVQCLSMYRIASEWNQIMSFPQTRKCWST